MAGITGIGTTGVTGATGPIGTAGGNSFRYTYSTTTTDSDPGSGILRLNNATMANVTQVFIDLVDFNGNVLTTLLDALDDVAAVNKGTLRLFDASDLTAWIVFSLQTVTTATGYRKLGVSYVSSGNALTTTAGNTTISFAPGGTDGLTGATGIAGVTGMSATPERRASAAGPVGATGTQGIQG